MLLRFLEWLKENTAYEVEVVLAGSGPLVGAFQSVARTHVWKRPSGRVAAMGSKGLHAAAAAIERQLLRMPLRGGPIDVVYANTAASWPAVTALQDRTKALVWHIHELSYALTLSIGTERAKALFPLARRFVAASGSVKDVLTNEFDVPPGKIETIHEFVRPVEPGPEEGGTERRRLLEGLGWPGNAFVIGGCGALGWRKGTDLFLQIAHRLTADDRETGVRFLWVGGGSEDEDESLRFAHEVKTLGLDGRCRRVSDTADVQAYFGLMGAFALTSREDPFPLVMLEAAMHGLPVVCFSGSGGGPEFAAGGAGVVVPYLDIPAFAHQLAKLRTHPDHAATLGACARRKVETDHTVAVQGPKILEQIETCL